jgi:opacity protein-like surface antigen
MQGAPRWLSSIWLLLTVGAAAPPAVASSQGATDTEPVAHASSGTDTEDRENDAQHRVGLGLAVGYGHGLASRERQRGRDVADVRFLAINSHVRMVLGRPGNGDKWYHGSLDGILEGSVLVNFEPHTGHAGGVLAALRYRMLPGRRIRPYIEGGIGLGRLAFGLASQDDGFSFFLNAGAGARWQLNEALSLTGSVRWHHISNAQTHLPNNSIDDVLFLIGVELW